VVAPAVDVELDVVGGVLESPVVDVPVVSVPLAELLVAAVLAVLDAAAAGEAVEVSLDDAESWRPLKSTPVRFATVLTCTKSELVSESAGTALPSTTSRP
jgi:hypothetical protein